MTQPSGSFRPGAAERFSAIISAAGVITGILSVVIALIAYKNDFNNRAKPGPTATTPTVAPTTTSSAGPGLVNLAGLDPVSASSPFFAEQTALIAAAVYPNSILIQFDGSEPSKTIEYEVGKRYTTLTLTVGLDDASLSTPAARLDLFGDGRLLASTKPKLGTAQRVSVRLDQVDRLTIIAKSATDSCCVDVALGSAQMVAK